PQRHPLCGPGADATYDFTLGLENGPADIALIGPRIPALAASRDRHGVGFGGLRANDPEGVVLPGTMPEGEIRTAIAVDAEASLPALIRAVRSLMTPGRQRVAAERARKHASANREATVRMVREAIDKKRAGWDASPISTARIYAE